METGNAEWRRLGDQTKTFQNGGEMMRKKLMVTLVLATLPACAGPKITAEDVAIARYQSESQQACYRAQAAQAQQYPDAHDQALIVMAKALAGRGSNPCGMTNVYDARAQNYEIGRASCRERV